MVELPTPAAWLEEQLLRRGWSQNEFARRAGIAASAVSRFVHQDCGVQTAVDIANALNTPVAFTLALIGKTPPPATMEHVEAETLGLIYSRLDDDRRRMLIEYARFLDVQNSRRK
jgi:transcriptional regulator with XRE-family HTH domain